jgi:hypothetical protein
MTAEIAIMNKVGVALAADSAVTITTPLGTKIFNTNKLFMLSKYHPVGVMVYGNAELMGIPWETIIKEYRKNLGSVSLSTLNEYGDNFISFLSNHKSYFSDGKQKRHVSTKIRRVYDSITNAIDASVRKIIDDRGTIEHTEFTEIIEIELNRANAFFKKLPLLDSLNADEMDAISTKYDDIVKEEIRTLFERLPLSPDQEKMLSEVAINLFVRNTFSALGNYSGIVIAGFGDDEIFPSIVEFHIELVVNNQLKFAKSTSAQINDDGQNAIVCPFAQGEMVSSFMEGISPDYKRKLYGELGEVFDAFSKKFSDTILEQSLVTDEAKKNAILEMFETANDELIREFVRSMESFSFETNVHPIVQSVGVLPLEELATMAESLVNLTSFKRRVTLDAETVGGPIDVAVISKGDGFIWIKRKHYFDAKYNPHFKDNYYRE